MRLRLTATPVELEKKGGDLIKALARELAEFDPGLGEVLAKAARVRDPKSKKALDNLHYPVLRELKRRTTAEYKAQLQGMLGDIDAVLEGKPLRKAFGDSPEKPEPGEEPEEKPEPGEYDPKTDEIVPEPEEDEDEDEDLEESESVVAAKDERVEG